MLNCGGALIVLLVMWMYHGVECENMKCDLYLIKWFIASVVEIPTIN